jgi:hypothetical protein
MLPPKDIQAQARTHGQMRSAASDKLTTRAILPDTLLRVSMRASGGVADAYARVVWRV